MKKLIITALIFSSNFCLSQSDEWTYIFDGKSFNGWHQYNSETVGSQWSINAGELIFTNNRDSKQDLVTVNEYSNFELSIEWNISRGGNSGIFFGVKELPEFDEAYITGPEIQVLDNKNFFTSTKLHKSPSLYDLVSTDNKNLIVNKYGEWNHLVLKIDNQNNEGTVTLNGQFAFSFPLSGPEWDRLVSKSKFRHKDYYTRKADTKEEFLAFGAFKSGKIGLQDHGSDVRFRNIKIRKLY